MNTDKQAALALQRLATHRQRTERLRKIREETLAGQLGVPPTVPFGVAVDMSRTSDNGINI
jgi:hypothetical protein